MVMNNVLARCPKCDCLYVGKCKNCTEFFHYCSYWGTWSRRLTSIRRGAMTSPFVEVNLTPIPSCFSSSWENDVKPIKIRAHSTANDRLDKNVFELPAEIRAMMVKNLGEELTNRLLTEDFLSQIDWEKYKEASRMGGGVCLDMTRKS